MLDEVVLRLSGTIGLLIGLPILVRASYGLRHTTLCAACGWAIGGFLIWVVGWVMSVLTSILERGRADQLWYAAVVLLLCPFISVLGAKRPGSRVWNWFVIIPLVLVLFWPAVVLWKPTMQGQALLLEGPALVGFLLVLVMGTGNYFGTQFTVPSILAGIALLLAVGSFSAVGGEQCSDPQHLRLWATVCLSAAIVVAAAISRSVSNVPSGCDRIWIDFRNQFGIVWASRIQVRINDAVKRENLPARLTIHGLIWADESVNDDVKSQTEIRYEHLLRWWLRRFVDPEWVDQRMQSND